MYILSRNQEQQQNQLHNIVDFWAVVLHTICSRPWCPFAAGAPHTLHTTQHRVSTRHGPGSAYAGSGKYELQEKEGRGHRVTVAYHADSSC